MPAEPDDIDAEPGEAAAEDAAACGDEAGDWRSGFEWALGYALNQASATVREEAMLAGGSWYHVHIKPAGCAFARWLLDEGIAVPGRAGNADGSGAVLVPYRGSYSQAQTLAFTLRIAAPGMTSALVRAGQRPAPDHQERLYRIQQEGHRDVAVGADHLDASRSQFDGARSHQ